MLDPERIGSSAAQIHQDIEVLKQRKENANWIRCGCVLMVAAGLACSGAAKVAFDLMAQRPPTATPDLRPRPTDAVRILTSTPWWTIPTETPVPNSLCITVSPGDTAYEIYMRLEQSGHNPNKPVLYYPPGSAVAESYMKDNLTHTIHPGGIFCGSR